MFKNYDDLSRYVKNNDIKMLDFKIPELTGGWRHLTVPAQRLSRKLFEEGFGFDGSNYGYADIEASDMVFIPDYTTAFVDPFWEKPTLSFLGSIYEITDNGKIPFINDSRTILNRALDYMKENGFADSFILGPEFEYYILDHVSHWNDPHSSGYNIDSLQAHWNSDELEANLGYKVGHKDGYHRDAPYDLHRDLRSDITLELEKLGIDVKYHHHEVGGPGQHEIETTRAEARKMGDASMLIKYFVKNMAFERGTTASFMPKPIYGEAGNGFHVHMQLFKNGKSIFNGPESNYAGLSDEALYFMGGVLKHTPALMGLTAPSTNSYKRLVKGYEAPVAICFATSNRSAVVRIPGYATAPEKKRFEFRPSDASGNPYLTFASLLMAGLDGIVNKINPIEEGYGPIDKNIYELDEDETDLEFLPDSLDKALTALEKDHEFLKKGNIFTEELIQSWINIKRKENEKVKNMPNPKEFELYFDI
ncbi:MAG: type I glutamate--ammonia ligase [Halanaerobiales bacterium]